MKWAKKRKLFISTTTKATLWITLAGVGFTLTMIGVRKVTPELHVFEAVFFRCLFGVIFMLPWVIKAGATGLNTQKPFLTITRGTLAYFVSCLYFVSATMIPLADMVSITFTRPIFGTIAAIIVLHEVSYGRRWIALFIGFIGMLIIIRPGFEALNLGILLALGGVAFQTANTIIMKFLTKYDQPDTIAFYHSLIMIPISIMPAFIVWVPPTLEQWPWLIGIGLTGMMTQRAQSRAFAVADASFVLALSFLRLPIAAIIGLYVFNEVTESWVWVGATIICASSTYIANKEAAAARQRDHV